MNGLLTSPKRSQGLAFPICINLQAGNQGILTNQIYL